jgi:hypothetical protein
MKILTTQRFHLTIVTKAVIKKTTTNVDECKEKGIFIHCWWECTLVLPLKISINDFKKLKTELPHGPAMGLIGIWT